MGIYGESAILAIRLFADKKSTDPCDAWTKATNLVTPHKSTRDKGCPKSTFLALCEKGWVQGVPKGSYTKSTKNKEYAIAAIELLRNKPSINSSTELWKQIVKGTKVHNGQMDVVLTLWKNDLIVQ